LVYVIKILAILIIMDPLRYSLRVYPAVNVVSDGDCVGANSDHLASGMILIMGNLVK